DYSLFVVSRYREEIHAGRSREDAVIRTVRTAGRTVLFSALTVALSLAALLVFPQYFLRSFAYAGIAVVALAAAAALLLLPAVRSDYTQNATGAVTVVAKDISSAPGAIGTYAARLSTVDGVGSVGSAAGTYAHGTQVAPPGGSPMTSGDSTYLNVSTSLDPYS